MRRTKERTDGPRSRAASGPDGAPGGRGTGRRLAGALVAAVAIGLAGWGGLALRFAGPRSAAAWLPFVWAAAVLAVLVVVRPLGRRVVGLLVAATVLFTWWSTLRPSNDRAWQPDVARPPYTERDGDRLTVHNVRNFDYRSEADFTERWETRTYDLAKLDRLDFYMSYWGSPAIAHTIMSWAFTDGQHLAVSIETRKEVGETYSAIAGFFRQYELYYVAADERDVIGLRTNHRAENVYLYPLRTPRDRARRALLEYAEAMNRLAATPEFYNAGTGNCTTTIRTNLEHMGVHMPFDWRFFVNGYLNDLLYEHGVIDTSRPPAVVKATSQIDARAQAAGGAPDFSARIRHGLVVPLRFDEPGAPPGPGWEPARDATESDTARRRLRGRGLRGSGRARARVCGGSVRAVRLEPTTAYRDLTRGSLTAGELG